MANLEFEWDKAKCATNLAKHGVGFFIACGVFRDVFAIERVDNGPDHGEERHNIIGMTENRLLFVAYPMRDDTIRIISARGATPHEQRQYHEENS